jgi:hypothetical protein
MCNLFASHESLAPFQLKAWYGLMLQMQEDIERHRRTNYGPTDRYQRALTGNHDLGWNQGLGTMKKEHDKSGKDWHGRNKTDVTTCEGICLNNHYGILL